MALFSDLSSDGLEETQDRIGGKTLYDTDVYLVEIKLAYAGKSQSGARNVTLVVDIDGKDYSETIYVTNKKGENFFINKDDKDKKKVPLPGFTIMEDICMMTTEKGLAQQDSEEKTVKIYDFDQKKEMPTAVQALTDLHGKKVYLAIVRATENKNEKSSDGTYAATADTRETNTIDKVFHNPTKLTVPEARNGLAEGAFFDKWVERNKGVTRDKRTIKDGAGTAGRPGGKSPPTAGDAPKAAKSLFGGS